MFGARRQGGRQDGRPSPPSTLSEKGWFAEEREIDHGTQFILSDGTVVNCYRTGKVVVQGKKSTPKQEAEKIFLGVPPARAGGTSAEALASPASRPLPPSTPTRVFIVYGHAVEAREQLELLLRRLRLEPIVLQNIPSAGDTIIEKLETLTAADFACVLVTPDDEGRQRCGQNDEATPFKPRARSRTISRPTFRRLASASR